MAKYHIQHTIMLKLDTEITIPNGLTEEEANEKLEEAINITLGKMISHDTSTIWNFCDSVKTRAFALLGRRVYKVQRGGWYKTISENLNPMVKMPSKLYDNLF